MQAPRYPSLSSYEDRVVPPTTLLQGVLPIVLASELPVGVVDSDGRLLGELDRRSVLAAINDGPPESTLNEDEMLTTPANWREEVAK